MSDQATHVSGNGSAAPNRAPPGETKHQRFRRLAAGRVQRALDALEQVARLSAPQNEYSDQEANRIVLALRGRMEEVEGRLTRQPAQKRTFSFD